jgi:hypothetical protein
MILLGQRALLVLKFLLRTFNLYLDQTAEGRLPRRNLLPVLECPIMEVQKEVAGGRLAE